MFIRSTFLYKRFNPTAFISFPEDLMVPKNEHSKTDFAKTAQSTVHFRYLMHPFG